MSETSDTGNNSDPALSNPELLNEPIKAGQVRNILDTAERLLQRKIDEGDGRFIERDQTAYNYTEYKLRGRQVVEIAIPYVPSIDTNIRIDLITNKLREDSMSVNSECYFINQIELAKLADEKPITKKVMWSKIFGYVFDDEGRFLSEVMDIRGATKIEPKQFWDLNEILNSLTGDRYR